MIWKVGANEKSYAPNTSVLKDASYFNSGSKDMDKSMENLMTTSNSFEEAYILYSTMKQIKVKIDEKKDFLHQMIHI